MPEALGRSCTDTRSGRGFAPGSRGRGPGTTADQKARKKGGADSDADKNDGTAGMVGFVADRMLPANVRDQHGQEWPRRLSMFQVAVSQCPCYLWPT